MPLVSRRTFLLTSGAAVAAAAGAGLYTWRLEPHWLEIVRRPASDREPAGGARGPDARATERHPRRPAARRRIRCRDLQGSGGARARHCRHDWRLHQLPDDGLDQLASVYGHFPIGPLATPAVLGNHDYGPGWSHPEIAARVADAVGSFGIKVMRNEITKSAACRSSASTTGGRTGSTRRRRSRRSGPAPRRSRSATTRTL